MIKPEVDLELSINALKVYGIEPNIIKNMLTNLQKVVNKNFNIPNVSCNCKRLYIAMGTVDKLLCEDCGREFKLIDYD